MNGRMATDSGLVRILLSRIARNSGKLAQDMENTLQPNANAINCTMETNASIWMNVPLIRTVEHKESALILVEQHCLESSAIAI